MGRIGQKTRSGVMAKILTKDGLPLTLGSKVSIAVRGEKFHVALRGWKEKEFIVIDHPVFQGETVKVAPLTGCSLHYTVDGTFINFTSTILYTLDQPVRLMVIEFPKRFEAHHLRKSNRQKTNFSFFFYQEENSPDVTHTGTLRDLSISGGLITHSRELKKGGIIFLTLQLPHGELTNIRARVQNVRVNPRNNKESYVTGIEFIKPTAEQDGIIRKFVESRVTERRGSGRSNGLK